MPQVIDESATHFPCPHCGAELVRHINVVRGWMGNELKQETTYVCPADATHVPADYNPAETGRSAARRRMPPMSNPPSDGAPMETFKPDVPGL